MVTLLWWSAVVVHFFFALLYCIFTALLFVLWCSSVVGPFYFRSAVMLFVCCGACFLALLWSSSVMVPFYFRSALMLFCLARCFFGCAAVVVCCGGAFLFSLCCNAFCLLRWRIVLPPLAFLIVPPTVFFSGHFEHRIRPSHHPPCFSFPGPAECAKRLNNSDRTVTAQ